MTFTKELTNAKVSNPSINYLHWGYRLLIAFVLAHLINLEGQTKPWEVLMGQANYWVAVGFSFIVGVLLIWLIHWFTRKLDRSLPWTSRLLWRVPAQFVCGVVLILLLDYLLVRGYFWIFDADFERSGYMQVEFPMIKWMVLFMNVLYIAWFYGASFFRSSKVNQQLNDTLSGYHELDRKKKEYQMQLEARIGSKVMMVDPAEVVCFQRDDNVGYVWMADGKKYNIDHKIPQLKKMLDPKLFFQISRSVMFSLGAIKGFDKVRNNQAELIVNEGLDPDLPRLVSRDRLEDFKKAYQQYANGERC